jgi:abequosyltransferase
MIKLTVCIPTYNFGKFIGQTLDSILPQISAEVEVIILDGGSTDETSAVVAARQRDCPQLAYHCQGFRGGIDRDIEKVVSLAQGKYCWLFSADDIMLPSAINKVLEAINSNHDVYICEHILCSFDMCPISDHPPFININQPKIFNLGDVSQKSEYFRCALTSEAFFSFMSGPIFKKSIWNSANIPESFRSTCWIVAGHLLSMIPRGITVNYLCEKLLHKRCENDSFSDRGAVNRYRIAIEGFQHVANSIFGEHSEEAFHIRRVLRTENTLHALLLTKISAVKNPSSEDIQVLNRIVKKLYSDPSLDNWTKYAIYLAASVNLLKTGSWIKRRIYNVVVSWLNKQLFKTT